LVCLCVTNKNTFMKYLLLIFLTAISVSSFGQTIINDKNAEVRNVGSFTGIKVSGGIDLYLSQSDNYALAVSATDEKSRDDIKTEINNGVLTISYVGGPVRGNMNRKLRAYISFPSLQSIEASGACDISFSNLFKSSAMKIRLSGACEVKGPVAIDDLQLELTGASTVKVNGTVQNLKIDASGASDVKNYDLVADNCIATMSGASDAKITVNKSLSVRASGASNFYYKGNPDRKDVNSSGASNISQRN
jgi:Putative auto-transporter adhesin, head GIN domain